MSRPGHYQTVIRAGAVVVFGALVMAGVLVAAAPAQAIYCWCQNQQNGKCLAERQRGLQDGQSVPLVCDRGLADESHLLCDDWCASQPGGPFRAIHCDEDANFVDWSKKLKEHGGCGIASCWCQTDKKECLEEQRGEDGILFDINSCNAYCRAKGAKTIHFDSTGDYIRSAECVGNPSPAPPAPAASAGPPSGITTGALLEQAKALDQLKAFSTPAQFIGQVISFLMAILGSLTLLFYIYAGSLWMLSSGNKERIEQAKRIFVWTTIGVVIMIGSYLIVNSLLEFIVLGQR